MQGYRFKYTIFGLVNNPIDRQQVVTLARRIYPSTCAKFMRKFEDATARPYGYSESTVGYSKPCPRSLIEYIQTGQTTN